MTARDTSDSQWLTATVEHDGLPLLLRVRPAADSPANRTKYPHVALVSHAMSKVDSNGLPEANYNDLLADFDDDVHAILERGGSGIVVLVETFAGKRNYYAYVTDGENSKASIDELREKYPQHSLNLRGGDDPEWGLFNDYRQRFEW